MAFTYDPALTDPVSQVRDMVRDVSQDYYTFEDETINYYLNVANGSVLGAAEQAAFRLWQDFTAQAEVSEVDKTRIENKNTAKFYKDIYEDLKRENKKSKMFSSGKSPVFFGGIDRSSFNANREDKSLTPNDFTKDMENFDRRYPELTKVGETPLETSYYLEDDYYEGS